MNTFNSVFAPLFEEMFDYREALGFSRTSYESDLLGFDRYCCDHNIKKAILTEKLAWGWLNEQAAKKRAGMNHKASALRMFGKYLAAIVHNAYILPDNMFAMKHNSPPYIFTDNELSLLFSSADHFSDTMIPVLFRLIYTCGLRPNEGRELKRENINFSTGEILITQTKRKKERVVVMSDDMLTLCQKYDARHSHYTKDNDFLFSDSDGDPLTSKKMNSLFNECWCLANPHIERPPNVRVYDLRHRFASAILNKWLDEGQDLYAMLPYLSAYMGHGSLSETAYYIHILPENLIKSAGIDWTAFTEIFPEVPV